MGHLSQVQDRAIEQNQKQKKRVIILVEIIPLAVWETWALVFSVQMHNLYQQLISLELVYCTKTVKQSWLWKMNALRNARHSDKLCRLLCWNGCGKDWVFCPLHEHFKTISCFGTEYYLPLPLPLWKIETKILLHC